MITSIYGVFLFYEEVVFLDEQKKFSPKGKATDPFDRKAKGVFQSDLYNLALDKDVAKKRNLLYLVLIAICVLAVVFIATTASYKTYVVRVDNTTGQIDMGGELKATNYQPQEMEIKHFLSEFILNTRTIPLDPIQYKNSLEKSKYFMTSEASQKFNALLMKDDPIKKLGRMTVQPEIRSVQLQPDSKNTYQVRWTEEEYSLAGGATGQKVNYVALFSVGIENKNQKEAELLINPLGLKIRDLNISREGGS